MKKQMLIPVGVSMLLAGLLALVAGGCGTDALDRRPCAEDLPCPQPVVNTCQDQNISSDQWTSLGLENEAVTAIAVHPCNPGIIYAGTSRNFSSGIRGKLFKSTDCGQSWDTLAIGGSYSTIQFSPGNPEIIYAVNGGILKSSDSGASWRRANEGIRTDAETGVFSLAVNPKNACRLYAGTGGFYSGDMYRSDDGGESWLQMFEREATAIAIDPADPATVYVGSNGDVLRSADEGATWQPTGLKDTGSLIHALMVDPEYGGRIFAGLNREGLHISINSGKSWSVVINEFLADTTSVVELEVDTKNGTLYVATTHGDSGRLLAYDLSSDVWKELPVPITDKSFYYSKLKVHVFEGRTYTYFGIPSGIYARMEE